MSNRAPIRERDVEVVESETGRRTSASRWYQNGDHPRDELRRHTDGNGNEFLGEGSFVRYFRHPGVPDAFVCLKCGSQMHYHGWVDGARAVTTGGPAGTNVCPGDWVVGTNASADDVVRVLSPEAFVHRYERVPSAGPDPVGGPVYPDPH